MEGCDIFPGKTGAGPAAKLGRGCFSADPLFANPRDSDYRLMPRSPCRNKADDGGDVGCRVTPKMVEMLKVVFELRKKGAIEF